MSKHPIERFNTWFISTAFASKKLDEARANTIAERRQAEVDKLHDIFDIQNQGIDSTNDKSAIKALDAVLKLDEKQRPGFVGDMRRILQKNHQSRFVIGKALTVVPELGGDGNMAIRDMVPLMKSYTPPIRDKALETVGRIGLRIIETHTEMLYDPLDRALAQLGEQCRGNSLPCNPEQAILVFSTLGAACVRERLEPMASTVLQLVDPVEQATENWNHARHAARTGIAEIRQALLGDGSDPKNSGKEKSLIPQYQ